jgi:glutaconate CoA-transferase, subunit B
VADYSTDDMMIVSAARALDNETVCFVGIGLPSTAANLARRLHAPDCVLIYESGCIGSKPTRLPLSIGDGELGETSDSVVSVPEIFAYWLQAGRVNVGFLGGAQLDIYGNINSTVIGPYDQPKTRLPGAGGAPEIAASAGAVYVIMRQSRRAFVPKVDFRSSIGFGDGPGHRERLGLRGGGVQLVVTDLGVMRPDPVTCELVMTALHPGVTREQATEATGWPLRFSDDCGVTAAPTDHELSTLAALRAA